jgi:signal transduction histidine kinase
MLGGEFTLDSAPGTGTRLTAELPLLADAPPSISNARGVL